jgi:hypothetical protein
MKRWGSALVGLAVGAAAMASVTVGTAAAATPPSQLSRGQHLTEGQQLVSDFGGGFALKLQTDGNLVEYLVSARRAVWATSTFGSGEVLTVQSDGNVVLYDAHNHALWNTGTAGTQVATFGVSVNGQLFAATARQALWETRPAVDANDIAIAELDSPNGRYRALMQTDGNFVVYSTVTGPLWSSGTAGHPGSYLVLQQTDGNVVIYASNGHALWSTHTSGDIGADLEMQNDGNLVLYAGPVDNERAVWASNTAGRP